MALPRSWSYPQEATSTLSGETVVITVDPAGPGFNLAADSIQVPNIITAPAASGSVFAPAAYTKNTASIATVVQNTLGYDTTFIGYFAVGNGGASVATFQVGVGPTATPAMTTVIPTVTASGGNVWSFPAHVPNGYYYSFQASQANGASVNGSLTIQTTPI